MNVEHLWFSRPDKSRPAPPYPPGGQYKNHQHHQSENEVRIDCDDNNFANTNNSDPNSPVPVQRSPPSAADQDPLGAAPPLPSSAPGYSPPHPFLLIMIIT